MTGLIDKLFFINNNVPQGTGPENITGNSQIDTANMHNMRGGNHIRAWPIVYPAMATGATYLAFLMRKTKNQKELFHQQMYNAYQEQK